MSLSCKQVVQVVMLVLQCSPGTSQRASAQPAGLGVGAAECGGMLGSNCNPLGQELTSDLGRAGNKLDHKSSELGTVGELKI